MNEESANANDCAETKRPSTSSETPTARRLTDSLLDMLEGIPTLCIVCHDNPDPDCLASALGLKYLAEHAGVEQVRIVHGGEITHQQNRAMVNLLEIDLVTLNEVDLAEFERLAFVDHSIPGRNNGIPEGTSIDIVVDHHPIDGVSASHLDYRPDVGATSTIITEYLLESDVELDERIATALLFGLHRETLNFTRGTTPGEHDAARYLLPRSDPQLVQRLSDTVFTAQTLSAIGDAIVNRVIRGSCLISTVGRTTERDVLPQAADYLLKLEGVSTTAVFGIIDDTVHISARTRNPSLDIGAVLRQAFDEDGSAGGHPDMAGGQIPLGPFAGGSVDQDTVDEMVTQAIERRLFEAFDNWTDR